MKCVYRFSVGAVLLAGLLCATPAMAQDVAIYGAPGDPAWNDDIQAKIQGAGSFASVDAFLVNDSTPTLGELNAYDAVFVYSDACFDDPVAMGDVLADYVDAGGSVVLATFALWSGNCLGMEGRLSTGGYIPFTQGSQDSPGNLTLVALDPGHPILAGVGSFDGGTSSYHNAPIDFQPGAEQVAEWSNGEPLIGSLSSPGGGVVIGLNFYPPSQDVRSDFWLTSTDGDVVMANALSFAAEGGLRVPAVSVPVLHGPATWAMMILLALIGLVALQRRTVV